MPIEVHHPDGRVERFDHQHDQAKCRPLMSGSDLCSESIRYYPENEVKSPDHYAYGGIETIDYIKAKLTKEQFTGYLWGNVLKYISRFDKKEGIVDLKKAKVYIDWLVDAYEGRLVFPHKVVE